MTQEQKAQAYDEVREKIALRFGSNVAEEVFSEFEMSEDERIRKWLYGYFRSLFATWIHPDITCEEILAWLEKQGEQEHTLDIEIPFGAKDSELKEATYLIPEGFHAEIEGDMVVIKKGKQNPVDDKVGAEIKKILIDYFNRYKEQEEYGINTFFGIPTDNILAWLEKQGSEPNWCHRKVDLSNCSEEYRKAYYDGWNNCNMQHSQCKSELDDVVKCLINGMKFYYEDNEEATWGTDKWSMPVKHIIEVLEKQGEQKPTLDFKAKNWYVSKVDGKLHNMTYNPADKVKPKFKVGDFIVNDYCMGKVIELTSDAYLLDTGQGIPFSCEHNAHIWTIEDAKDGDVLASNHNIFIFSQEYIAGKPEAHCGIMNGLFIVKPEGCWTNEKCYPATKEQQDILYQKMNEEGYEWLADKKELKMIEQKPAESRQKTKPNGGIVYEDFNEGDGYYKVNLAYLSKSQVELIENLVASWQNPTNNTVEWSEEDEKNLAQCIEAIDACYKWDSMIDWLKSLRSRSRWKPSEEQMKALDSVIDEYDGYPEFDSLVSLKNDLKKL